MKKSLKAKRDANDSCVLTIRENMTMTHKHKRQSEGFWRLRQFHHMATQRARSDYVDNAMDPRSGEDDDERI